LTTALVTAALPKVRTVHRATTDVDRFGRLTAAGEHGVDRLCALARL